MKIDQKTGPIQNFSPTSCFIVICTWKGLKVTLFSQQSYQVHLSFLAWSHTSYKKSLLKDTVLIINIKSIFKILYTYSKCTAFFKILYSYYTCKAFFKIMYLYNFTCTVYFKIMYSYLRVMNTSRYCTQSLQVQLSS